VGSFLTIEENFFFIFHNLPGASPRSVTEALGPEGDKEAAG
jgi:hypothetical protein